jgi:hypothetical protein
MAAEQRASVRANRMWRLLSRVLLVVGGTVAGTAAAWLLSAAAAVAAPDVGGVSDLTASITTDVPSAHRNAADLAGVLRFVTRDPARPAAGPVVEPATPAALPLVGTGDRPDRAAAPLPQRLAGAVAGPVAAATELTGSATPPPVASWPGEAAPRPDIDQVTGALGDALGVAGQLAHGGLAQGPVAEVGGLARTVPGAPETGAAPVATAPAPHLPAGPATALATGWTRSSAPVTAHPYTSAPATVPAPLAPAGPPVSAPASTCACGPQGSASSGGHPVGATVSTVGLPGTVQPRPFLPGAQPVPGTPGAQPGVTPD